MACCLLYHNISYSSDNNGTDSSMSFRLDSDNAVSVNFPIDITNIITLTYLYSEWVEIRIEPVGTALGSSLQKESLTEIKKNFFL
ncbi:hypothetical protein BO71DRAFT_463752 [Aspergillus ellipticus CBS 707.79]|uniref:Uncharacterized protein n=1 Tax=Aspergillus ellipticus CBS 707.79 TaxID=1448320 RepID=A0A319CXL5_9EURO|nr:hypothetical protein BO71DRAFT_463752 [Aspergillus ellipticus CBS 707.79]